MTDSNALVPVQVPGTDRPIMAAEIDGTPMVAFRPLCDALGVGADSQLQKIKSRSWARTTLSTVRHEDELDGLLDVDLLSRVDAVDLRRHVRIVVAS